MATKLKKGSKGNPLGTRKFNGEKYSHYALGYHKNKATKIAKYMRQEGYNVRVIKGKYEYPFNPQKGKKGNYYYVYVSDKKR